jgi:hypothetical protein
MYGNDTARRFIICTLQQIEEVGIIGACSIDEENKKCI